ncbi:MAG: protein-disulfide reductase DsbD [Pantoea sp.]|nr:protein-disulfide reductase DsbD [Pantoea sp.]
MAARISCLIAFALALFITLPTQASIFSPNASSRFVPVDQAFAFDFSQQGRQLTLSWKVKEGYYLYRQQIHVSAQQAQIAPVALPPGQPHEDEFYGKSEIYSQDLQLPVQLREAASGASLRVTYQGCAAAGFCYPPETRTIPLTPVAADAAPPAGSVQPAPAAPLPFSPLWALLIGIGVAFTPCVLPMYPLIAGIILGGQRSGSLLRLFSLALIYVLGMALTYTLLGVVVAAAGLRFQAALQHPYMLIGLSLIFTLLALSMFGLFQLQLPASVQTRLTLWSNRQQGGSLPGVFLMGALAGLICSPCTTAPLSAILLYIAQSGNLWAGAGTLWLYAMGMGLPLIVVTLFGNRLLPKSGPWMQTVKQGLTAAQLPFQRIASAPQLDEALRQANGRVTMVDLYADWCVACKEFEKYTFSDPGVREALSRYQLLQANVTANNATDNALLQHLQVLGLPTILFFDAQGREIPGSRVTGFLNAEDFRTHLQNRAR